MNPLLAWPLWVAFREVLAVVKADAYERLAARLHRLLAATWDDHTRRALEEITERLRGREPLTVAEVEAIHRRLAEILGEAFTAEIEADLREIVAESYVRALSDTLGLSRPRWDLVDARALDWLQRHHVYWVRHHYDRHLAEDVLSLGEQAILEGMSRREAGRLFREALGRRLGQSQLYWEMFANHVVTRSQELGRVEGYERAGVRYLQIRAVLDHRTSCICRNLHGRIIEVDKAARLARRLVAADDPEDVKRIAPWEPCERVMGVPSAELPEHLALPPYHFGCRTRTVVWKPPEDVRVEAKEMGAAVRPQDRPLLDQYTEAEYAGWVEDIRRRADRLRWNEKDLKHDLRKHAPDFGISPGDRSTYTAIARSVVADPKYVTAHVYKGQIQFVLYGENAVVIVDQQMRIRGVYHSADVDRTFVNWSREQLWLRTGR